MFFRENLSFTQVYWITKVLLVNFVLFVSLFFLTTPTVIVTALSYYKLTSPLQMLVSDQFWIDW